MYAGGDDVLAMLPVTNAVACAHELAEKFATTLDSFSGGTVKAALSVGIAIRHVFDPLGTMRRDAARALKLAKEGDQHTTQSEKRNALCLLFVPRSGAEVAVRGQWSEDSLPPLYVRLAMWEAAFRARKVSSKAAYDLREVMQMLSDEHALSRREAVRVLSRKRDGAVGLDAVLEAQLGDVIERRGVVALVTELLIARRIAGLAA